jgi:hypothetical protein
MKSLSSEIQRRVDKGQSMFRSKTSAPSSGMNSKPGKKPTSFACCLFHSGLLLALHFNTKDGCDMLLRNVG